MRWFRQQRLLTRALLAIVVAWLLAAQAASPAPLSAAAEALRAIGMQASIAEGCDGQNRHEHNHWRLCQACCPSCPAEAGDPFGSASTETRVRARARFSTRIANLPSERADGRPLGWGGSWSSRAPPSFS